MNQKFAPHTFETLKKLPLYTLVETLIRLLGFDQKANSYIFSFTENVYAFTQKNDTSVLAFLEWFDTKKDKLSINTPENINAVTISTIHKAKGLEYPIVIFPFDFDKKDLNFKPNDFLWLDISPYHTVLPKVPIKAQGTPKEWSIATQAIQREKELKLLDEINVLYVALTRPKEQLYWLINEKKSGISYQAQAFAKNYLNEKAPDSNSYYTGTSIRFNSNITYNTDNTLKLTRFPAEDWTNKVKIAFQAPEVWDINHPKSYTENGKILHRILSEIKTADDIDFILYKYEVKGIVSENEISQLKPLIIKLFTLPQTKQWFKTVNAKNEVPLLLPDGTSYRIDRLVFFENKTHVIDFKTGSEKQTHRKQVINYCSILKEMGHPNVKGFLIYLPDCNVVEV